MLDFDRKLDVELVTLSNKGAKAVRKLSKPRIKSKQVNTASSDVETALHGALGVALTKIHVLGHRLGIEAHRRGRH